MPTTALLAQERALCAADDVMDLFKRSVFAGEFEPPSFEVGETREDPRNWLHMEIEAPRCTLPPDHAALSVRPKQLSMFDYRSYASMLLALGLCNSVIGIGILLSRERVWLRLARWIASLSDDHLTLLLGLVARGQIVVGLVLLVLGIVVVRRAVGREHAATMDGR